jgi:hypothetical protein
MVNVQGNVMGMTATVLPVTVHVEGGFVTHVYRYREGAQPFNAIKAVWS